MPVPDGLSAKQVESVVRAAGERTRIAGLGITGLGEGANPARLADILAAAGF